MHPNPAPGRSKPAANADVVFKVAETAAERRSAFRITYEAYLRTGLSKPNHFGLRVTPFHLLATTTVFVARQLDRTISTLSLVEDGELGLPMEVIYGDKVQESRDRGRKVAEVSCLADRCVERRHFLNVFCELSRLTAQFARYHGIDQLMAVVHPKHARFYQRYLGFEPIGGLAECPHVLNKPAVALCLDFERIDRRPPGCYDRFFGVPVPREQLRRRCISETECQSMAGMIDDSFHVLSAAALPSSTCVSIPVAV